MTSVTSDTNAAPNLSFDFGDDHEVEATLDSSIAEPDIQAQLSAWLDFLSGEKRLAPNTVEAYAQDLHQVLAFLSRLKQRAVSISMLRAFSRRDFELFTDERETQGVSPRSSARALSSVKGFLRFLSDKELVSNDLFFVETSPRHDNLQSPQSLPVETILAFFKKIDEVEPVRWIAARDRAVLLLCYGAGLDIAEALNLCSEDLSVDAIRVTGKRGRTRVVPMLKAVKSSVDAYLSACPFELVPVDFIFRGVDGGVLASRLIQRRVAQVRDIMELPSWVTPKTFRYSFAAHLLERGVSLVDVQRLLGHVSIASTAQHF